MNSFFNLSAKQSIGLDKPIYNNALRLRKDANLIAGKNQSFSTATSLLILSSEEVIKAILVFLHSQGYKVYRLQDSKKFFRDHKIRHQLSQLIETGYGLLESSMKLKESPKAIANTKIRWLNSAINELGRIAGALEPFVQTSERIEKLNGFNDSKNNGLYVGFKNGLMVPSEMITKDYFEEVQEIIERTFKFYKMLRVLHNPMIFNHRSPKEINQLKAYLHDFIDKALMDFSFKELNDKNRTVN
ncbi:AbiV family abortive infection protein [Mangrovimonas xylaniphaga]|uniref:AbiV family abortive infection protein n=1 Tax=Mangrovimonas xylaniphaga TaxID=1645915 RepID=UPI0012F8E452|nr:AbiV family abortive infection protein [Mangrovimonas xylaniphaga]